MTELLLDGLATFMTFCITAITIQNSVFARALSISRLISMVDHTTSTGIFGALLVCISVLGGTLNFYANSFLVTLTANPGWFRPLVMLLCMSVAYLFVFVIVVKFARYENIQKAVDALPLATFNCTVIGTLLLTITTQYDLFETICYCIGTGIGYVFAITLVTEGQRKVQTPHTPIAFRGLPVTLLYLAGLALAVYGLTGYSFAF